MDRSASLNGRGSSRWIRGIITMVVAISQPDFLDMSDTHDVFGICLAALVTAASTAACVTLAMIFWQILGPLRKGLWSVMKDLLGFMEALWGGVRAAMKAWSQKSTWDNSVKWNRPRRRRFTRSGTPGATCMGSSSAERLLIQSGASTWIQPITLALVALALGLAAL